MNRDGCLELGLTAEQALERIAVRTVDEIAWDRQGREFQLLLNGSDRRLRGVVEETAGGCRVRWSLKGPVVRLEDIVGVCFSVGIAILNLFFLPMGDGIPTLDKVQGVVVLALIGLSVKALRRDGIEEWEVLDRELRARLAAA
jgi:hypothetical protein